MRNGLRVGLPNGTLIQTNNTGLLTSNGPLPPISTDDRCVSLLPGLTRKFLISIDQLNDDGYSAVFTTHTVRLVKDDAPNDIASDANDPAAPHYPLCSRAKCRLARLSNIITSAAVQKRPPRSAPTPTTLANLPKV